MLHWKNHALCSVEIYFSLEPQQGSDSSFQRERNKFISFNPRISHQERVLIEAVTTVLSQSSKVRGSCRAKGAEKPLPGLTNQIGSCT